MDRIKCELCDKTFARQYLAAHIRVHTGERPYKCKRCNKSYTSNSGLNMHLISHCSDRERKHACTICPKRFPSYSVLENHMRSHTGETPFKCSKCGKRFTIKGNLATHQRTHTKNKPYSCKICHLKYGSKRGLDIHNATYHGDGVKCKCSRCGKFFKSRYYLVAHVRKWHREKANAKFHQCIFCNIICGSNSELLNHIRRHTKEKALFCELCGCECFNMHSKSEHLRRWHTKEKPFKCQYCHFTFFTAVERRNHQTIHTDNGKCIKCGICGKLFRRKKNLWGHTKRVHPEKPLVKRFKCTLCEVAFVTRPEVNRHMRTHERRKGYFSCVFCDDGKLYQTAGSYLLHVCAHTGERPYMCKICGLETNEKRRLSGHEKIHNRHCQFKCGICKKSFKVKWYLKKHQKRAHPECF